MIDFIIPTYNRPRPLFSMLSSLVAQTADGWSAKVIVDGTDFLKETLDVIYAIGDARITHFVTDRRYNDWGHTPREIGKQMSVADYVIMTGDDNYYVPKFVEEVTKICGDRVGMIYWDMVHSYYNYSHFVCSPVVGRIDMGAFATRRDLAQQICLGKEFVADGLFVEQFVKRFPEERVVKIEKVLFVHN